MFFFLVKILITLGYYNAGKLNVYTCLDIIQIKQVNKLILRWSLEKSFLGVKNNWCILSEAEILKLLFDNLNTLVPNPQGVRWGYGKQGALRNNSQGTPRDSKVGPNQMQ